MDLRLQSLWAELQREMTGPFGLAAVLGVAFVALLFWFVIIPAIRD
jgi:hypothetical protein